MAGRPGRRRLVAAGAQVLKGVSPTDPAGAGDDERARGQRGGGRRVGQIDGDNVEPLVRLEGDVAQRAKAGDKLPLLVKPEAVHLFNDRGQTLAAPTSHTDPARVTA